MVSRRTVISASLAVGAASIATGAAIATSIRPSAAAARPVRRTIARQKPIVGGRLRASTETPLTHLAVSWDSAEAVVRTRDANGWTEQEVGHRCSGGPDQLAVGQHTLVPAAGVVEYDIALADGGSAGMVTELNTVDGPVLTTAAEPLAGMPLPDGSTCPVTYLSRAAWGADEALRFAGGTEVWPAEFAGTQALTVHHTAGANNDPDPAATIRAIYYYQSVTLGWGDVGYHLFIDEQGRVYEGRWSGPDAVPVFDNIVAADTQAGLVTAGHVGGYNTGNFGVCLLGDFTRQQPTAAAANSLVTVLASMARVTDIDPEQVVNFVGPTGATRTVLGVSGHRDWMATECPGNTFYPQLPAVRSAVADLIRQGPSATPSAPSPTPSPTKRHGRKP